MTSTSEAKVADPVAAKVAMGVHRERVHCCMVACHGIPNELLRRGIIGEMKSALFNLAHDPDDADRRHALEVLAKLGGAA